MKNVRTMWVVPFRDKTLTGLVAVVLFLCACPALGVLEFKDGLTHDIDYAIADSVWVDFQSPSMYTTVNLIGGGSTPNLRGYEQSRINVRGGSTGLHSLDSSHVYISGGEILSLISQDSSYVAISGGSIGELYSWDSSQVNITGGSIYKYLCSFSSSQVDIFGGSIKGPLYLDVRSFINIYGSNFAVDGQPFGYGELTSILGGPWDNEPNRRLTGILASGDLLNNDFYIGRSSKIVLVPEPATLALFGLGFLFLRKRHDERSTINDRQPTGHERRATISVLHSGIAARNCWP